MFTRRNSGGRRNTGGTDSLRPGTSAPARAGDQLRGPYRPRQAPLTGQELDSLLGPGLLGGLGHRGRFAMAV